MSRQVGGHTLERHDALAVREGPPSPAVRPGPIHGMGRAVRYRAHALSGLASAKRNADDEHSSTIARTFFQRPAQAGNGCSARDSDHEDMRMSRWRGRVDECAHLPALPEEFERHAASRVHQQTRRGQQRLAPAARQTCSTRPSRRPTSRWHRGRRGTVQRGCGRPPSRAVPSTSSDCRRRRRSSSLACPLPVESVVPSESSALLASLPLVSFSSCRASASHPIGVSCCAVCHLTGFRRRFPPRLLPGSPSARCISIYDRRCCFPLVSIVAYRAWPSALLIPSI